MIRRLLATLALLVPFGSGGAGAHATLETSEPASQTSVTQALREIRLVFSEVVEVAFSRFEVHRLAAGDAVDRTAETAWQRLNGLAAELASAALDGDGSPDTRVEVAVVDGPPRSDEVVLDLPEDMAPGTYVVLWRALSIDTHAAQGLVLFDYAPPPGP